MSFEVSWKIAEGTARITLAGEIDANAVPALRQAVEEAAARSPRRLLLLVSEVRFMASAGLRVLAFAKQKMGASVDIHVVGACDAVRRTLVLTGLHHGIVLIEGGTDA